MCRPTLAISAALLASLAVLCLLTELVKTQTSLTESSASVDGDSLTITLSAAVDATSDAVASDFAVSAGDEELTIDSADVDGATVTLTLAESVGDPDCDSTAITVSYERSGSSITASGSELRDFADLSATNQTDKAPAIESIETDATGRYIYVTFCEAIATGENGWLTIAAFTAYLNGSSEPINDVTISSSNSKRLVIQFGSAVISEGDTVTITYDRSNADDGDPPQDADQGGKLVKGWLADDHDVTNSVDSPPELVSVTALWDVITLTFSEPLDEDSAPDKSAFTITDRPYSVTINSVEVSGKTVTLDVSDVIRGELTPKFQLSYVAPGDSPLQQADGAKQAGDFDGEAVVSSTPTTKPVVESAEVKGATLTITFDMPLMNVAGSSAFTVSGAAGVSANAASFSGNVVTLTLSAAVSSGDNLTVSYEKPDATPRIEARNIRDADSFSNQAVTNNTSSSTPTFVSASINAAGDTLTITLSNALLETSAGTPAASAFSLAGGTAAVGSVAVSGTTVALSLSPRADLGETITVAYAQPTGAGDGKLQSLSDSHLVDSWSAQSVTNHADGTPRPTGAAVNGAALTISFDRSLDAMSKPSALTFTLGGTMATISSVSISGSTVSLSLSAAAAHDDVITVSYAKPQTGGIKRSGQALFADSFDSLEVTNATTDPTPRFVSAAINAAGDTLSITMSGDLLETTAGVPTASAFSLAGGTAAVGSVSVSGTTVTLALSPKADAGETITVAYAQPTGDGKLQSPSGAHLVDSWSAQSVTNHADGAPRPTGATVNGAALTIGFDRPLDAMSKPAISTFTLGGTTETISSVSISGSTVSLSLSAAVAHDDVITVSYAKPQTGGIKRSGQALFAEAFSDFGVTNETPKPLIRSVVGDEDEIEIAFSSELDTTSTPDSSAFSLGEDEPSIDSVTVGAMSVSFGLAKALSEGGEYTLTYTAPSESPLKTSEAATVASFSKTVTNETDVAPQVESATANGATVSLVFDQALNGDSALAATAFDVSADATTSVSAVSYNGEDGLTLTLSRSLAEDESATLDYVQPSTGGIADPGGKRTASFSLALDNQTDTAPAPTSGSVTDNEIVIVLDQDIFDDPRFHDDDGYPTAHFTLTGTDAAVAFVQVSNGGAGGVGKIVITLSEDVDELDTVQVRYFPTGGTIRIRDDDAGENRAQINSYRLENLTKTAPSVVSATLDGSALSLVFDRPLDEDVNVETAWFSFASGGLSVESGSVGGSTLSLGVSPSATEDAEHKLTYTPPESGGLASASDVLATGFSSPVSNVTDYAPFAVSASAEAAGAVPGANQIVLRFDQRLDPSGTFEQSWFALTPALEVKAVIVDSSRSEGDQLLIQLEEGHWVREGASVSLDYTQPKDGGLRDDDGDPEEEGDGSRVADFMIAVANSVDVAPQLSSATVNRERVTLIFDQDLDLASVPPPNCLWLESEIEEFDCPTDGEPTWFSVQRNGVGSESIASVGVQGSTVTLTLEERMQAGDSVNVAYQLVSIAGVSNRSLRDTSDSPNEVGSFGPTPATNVTAAAPTDSAFDRSEPAKIVVTFDAALKQASNLNADPLRVTADEEALAIRQVRADDAHLTVALQRAVPECAALGLRYAPAGNAWLDDEGRAIEAFDFGLANLIDATRGLACIESDVGALALTFVSEAEPAHDGWSLMVNGEPRQLRVDPSSESLQLVPSRAVCVGDSLAISWMPSDAGPPMSLDRVVERAAPCVISAIAVGERLELTFDQQLDSALPDLADFMIDRGGQVTGVVGIEGRTLTLELESPGIDADADATLTYVGSSLRGGGLTVGTYSVPVTDRTNPPELTTAFGLGDLIVLNFDQPLRQRSVPVAWFELVGPDLNMEIASVTIGGSSVHLQLTRSLPDDLDLFGVVYHARGTRGLAGVSGVLVPTGVFVVQNYTETAPQVSSVTVNKQEAVLNFDQQIDASDGKSADFAVLAGHRRISIASLDWSSETITLSLAEPVTSLDSTRLTYSPGTEETVRDLSGLPLAAFDMPAENLTPSARTDAQIVEEARLRAGAGATSIERELARAFASEDGARFAALPGDGAATVVLGGMRVMVELSQWSEDAIGISMTRLSSAPRLMRLLEQVPSACANSMLSTRLEGWLLELQDQHGAPRVEGVGVTLGGLEAARLLGGCVLDLIAGSWTLMPLDGRVVAPSLIVPGATTAFTRWVSLTPGA